MRWFRTFGLPKPLRGPAYHHPYIGGVRDAMPRGIDRAPASTLLGLGAALTEAIAIDKRDGFFVNCNLAEYHVAAHADVPAIDAVFIPELDDRSSAMKSKAIGELGICGAGAAVANAIYNATGIRIRDYPLTLDEILDGWESGKDQRPVGEKRADRM